VQRIRRKAPIAAYLVVAGLFSTPHCLIDGVPMLRNLLHRAGCRQSSAFESGDHSVDLSQTRLNPRDPGAEGAQLLSDDLRFATCGHSAPLLSHVRPTGRWQTGEPGRAGSERNRIPRRSKGHGAKSDCVAGARSGSDRAARAASPSADARGLGRVGMWASTPSRRAPLLTWFQSAATAQAMTSAASAAASSR
jgi:hypothetical protein